MVKNAPNTRLPLLACSTNVYLSAARVFCYTALSWFDDAIAASILCYRPASFSLAGPTWRTTRLVPFASTQEVFMGSALS
jgi:hypothetical protein